MRHLPGLLGAAALVAASLVLAPTPAGAAYCGSGSGVNVVVEFGALPGGTVTGCGSGSTAAAAVKSAGHTLTNHPQQQSFVCKVDGEPADGDCLQTDRYWAIFVSNDGGAWTYASSGAYSQSVDAGDSVAFVWQSSNTRNNPNTAPAQPPAAPASSSAPQPVSSASATPKPSAKPTRKPSAKASAKPSAAPTLAAPTPAASTTTPTATPGASRKPKAPASSAASATPTASPTGSSLAAAPTPSESPSASATTSAVSDPATPTADGGGLPGWVPPVLVALLAAAAGGVALARRRRG